MIRNLPCYYRPGTDKGILSYCHARVDDAPGAYRGELLHSCLKKLPFAMGFWILVVGEGYAWSYEHVVLNYHARRDEDEGSDLAIIADCDAFFDIDEGVDLGILSDCATVEVYLVIDAGGGGES